jgi:uncharacterized protein (TIGR03066 family)
MSRKSRKRAANGLAVAPAPRFRWLRRCVVVLLVVGVIAGASYALFDHVLPSRLPREMLGTWRVVDGKMRGATLEFRRDGTMFGKFEQDDNTIEATVEVDGKTLRTTTTNPYTKRSDTWAQTIVTLTRTEFVTEEPKGTRIRMERVR